MNAFIFNEENNKYNCPCGSQVSHSYRGRHLRTQKHIAWSSSGEQECSICYEEKREFFTCPSCSQQHCNECTHKITKCPFCRHLIHECSVDHILVREVRESGGMLRFSFQHSSNRVRIAVNYVINQGEDLISHIETFRHEIESFGISRQNYVDHLRVYVLG